MLSSISKFIHCHFLGINIFDWLASKSKLKQKDKIQSGQMPTSSSTSKYRNIAQEKNSDAVDVAFDEAIDIISSEAERDLAQSSLQVR